MRGGKRRQQRPNIRAELNAFKREMVGHTIVPASNPQSYVQRPWNSWTFQRTDITTVKFEAVTITVADIIGQIRGRCNINPVGEGDIGNNISIRVLSSSVWVTASSLILPDVEVQFYELNPNDAFAQVRYTQRDVGTLNMPAKVGYKYPLTDTKQVLDSNNDAVNVVSASAAAAASDVTHRIQVLWRSSK